MAMAMRVSNRRALGSVLTATRNTFIRRNESSTRAFTSSQAARVVVSQDTPNMRKAQRDPDPPEGLHAAPVNPADKYAAKAGDMHRYGSWLMGCLPKYIQQFSVWKDELVIYISPSGVIPVFSFLKCMVQCFPWSLYYLLTSFQTTPLQSSRKSPTSQPSISPPETSDSKSSTTC